MLSQYNFGLVPFKNKINFIIIEYIKYKNILFIMIIIINDIPT